MLPTSETLTRHSWYGGGRRLLHRVKRDRGGRLPWTRLQAGVPVLLRPERGPAAGLRGVVCERTGRLLCVAVAEPPDDEERTTYRVSLAHDEVGRQRQR